MESAGLSRNHPSIGRGESRRKRQSPLLLFLCPLFLLGISALSVSGCALVAGGAAGAATASYFSGELRSVQERPIRQVFRASEDTITAMNYTLKERSTDPGSAYLRTAESPNQRVTISMKELNDATTELRIRVGILGDELQARHILEEIESRLGEGRVHPSSGDRRFPRQPPFGMLIALDRDVAHPSA